MTFTAIETKETRQSSMLEADIGQVGQHQQTLIDLIRLNARISQH